MAEEEVPIIEDKEDDPPIVSEDPADAAIHVNKKKRLCRHAVSFIGSIFVSISETGISSEEKKAR